jgi:putative FmdB family regulatory protein
MPTYDYVCDKCGAEFELFQSMKDNAITVCTKDLCPKKRWGKGTVKRQMGTGAGIIFKGSGFYETDYRSEGYKSAAKKDSEAAAPASTEKPKTDSASKPAEKTKKAAGSADKKT